MVMAELALFAHDHSLDPTISTKDLAALPKRYDLICAQENGWNWGTLDNSHLWFRILQWTDQPVSAFQQFLSPLLPEVDVGGAPTTFLQYRGFFINIANAPGPLIAWFNLPNRATPRFPFVGGIVTPGSLSS